MESLYVSSKDLQRPKYFQLIFDGIMVFLVTFFHSIILIMIAMIWYVAIDLSSDAFMAFVIVCNFGEVKGTVFKRFDAKKLNIIVCMVFNFN